MDILNTINKWGYRYYYVKEDGEEYYAESIFVNRQPRSRIILETVKSLEEIINKNISKLNHPAFIKFKEIKRIKDEYCLIRDKSELVPLTVYLKEQNPSPEKRVLWFATLIEIAQNAEESDLNWSGFRLDTLWVNEEGELRLIDPEVVEVISQYRGLSELPPFEVFIPPEVFKEEKWNEPARIYSAGAILYYILTGQPPYTAPDKADLIDEIMNTQPLEPRFINYDLSPSLNSFILKLLSRDKNDRPGDWHKVMVEVKSLIDNNRVKAEARDREINRQKAERVIKIAGGRKSFRRFFRKYWKPLAVSLVVIIGFGLLSLTGGHTPVVTQKTPAPMVVEYFYQAIDEKNIIKLEDTTDLDLGRLDTLVSESHVMETMRSIYSVQKMPDEKLFGTAETDLPGKGSSFKETPDKNKVKSNSSGKGNQNVPKEGMASDQQLENNDGKIFGIRDLNILPVKEGKDHCIYRAEYVFYANLPEGKQETSMEDTLELERIDRKWQITGLKGDINYIIDGQIEKILYEGKK
ncbi:protein kinase domain-containing protein [Halothermothrix orenii]|uniref:Serine/threonine protein kinase n=1 Tax=Halothermothrix orenii (strain H 168 / OCM 544 / DSM 9562) TaxID=373903 RepID=B8CZD3_HALOH|nr:serine/threonine protein kinase [Halothermothrix orenii]ACL70652.1 serine/threonine protein kinase [Halothermothrix orenii H 168]